MLIPQLFSALHPGSNPHTNKGDYLPFLSLFTYSDAACEQKAYGCETYSLNRCVYLSATLSSNTSFSYFTPEVGRSRM
jgi:hypothetical protein